MLLANSMINEQDNPKDVSARLIVLERCGSFPFKGSPVASIYDDL